MNNNIVGLDFDSDSNADEKTVTLLAEFDGGKIVLSKEQYDQSDNFKNMKMDVMTDGVIPLKTTVDQIQAIYDYTLHHVSVKPKELPKHLNGADIRKEYDEWDAEFVKKMSTKFCMDLLCLVNFLMFKDLRELLILDMAYRLADLNDAEVRKELELNPNPSIEEQNNAIRLYNKHIGGSDPHPCYVPIPELKEQE